GIWRAFWAGSDRSDFPGNSRGSTAKPNDPIPVRCADVGYVWHGERRQRVPPTGRGIRTCRWGDLLWNGSGERDGTGSPQVSLQLLPGSPYLVQPRLEHPVLLRRI